MTIRDEEPTRLISIAEAASQLALSQSAVARMIRNGQLPFVVIGRRKLIRDDHLEAFIEDATVCGCGRSKVVA
jgi:excisionase family DNA binding protein